MPPDAKPRLHRGICRRCIQTLGAEILDMPENNVTKFKRMRSQVLKKGVLSFIITVITLFVWVYLYSLINIESDILFFSIGAVISFGWYFGYIVKLENKIICPACKTSLIDADGWSLFIKECPNCKAQLL
jgi:uncharacterized membrane protein (DUF485 family)